MTKLFVDSWAWLEFFKGSKKGKAVKRELAAATEVYTVATNLFETLYRTREDGGTEAEERARRFIQHHSHTTPIDEATAIEAVNVRETEKLHALDALPYAASKIHAARFLTGDPHFKGKKNVVFID